tara:strand:+ start:3917 stop:4441 length:525 start_codon:yes stop_codon:yes gene_type:complete
MKNLHEMTVDELAADEEYMAKTKKKLETFKNRWFAWGKSPEEDGRIAHFMACNIFRSKEVYGFATCTCGLLYDLRAHMPFGNFASKLFPIYGEQDAKQEQTWEQEQEWAAKSEEEKQAQRDECQAMLEKTFGPIKEPDPVEVAEWDELEWKIIHEVFGPNFRENTERIYEKYIV